jgi:hypothetical protein
MEAHPVEAFGELVTEITIARRTDTGRPAR